MRNDHESTGVLLDKDRVRRLFVLALVGSKEDGIFGRIRLQKLGFFAEKDAELRPFRYHRYDHGQYCPDLQSTANELVSMGLLCESPLESGSKYQATNPEFTKLALAALGSADPALPGLISDTVAKYRYASQTKLLDEAYKYLEGIEFLDEVLAESWPRDGVFIDPDSLPGGADAAEDLILATNPDFVRSSLRLVEGMGSGVGIDPDKVRHVEFPGRTS